MITFFTFLVAVIPALLISYFIIKWDKYEKEPLPLLLISFGLGIGIFFVAQQVEGVFDGFIKPFIEEKDILEKGFNPNTHLGALLFYAFVRTAFVEEFLKLAILLSLPFHRKEFNEPMDGIVYAVMIGMGFAVIENLLYCLPHNFPLALVRDFTAVPAHAVFGVILGYYFGLVKFEKKNKIKNILIGFFLAVFVHGLYGFFLFQEFEDWLMILATFVLLVGLFFSRKFIIRHQKGSPFKNPKTPEFAFEKPLPPVIANEVTQEEDNEILDAVLLKMKENQDEEEE